MAALSKHGGAKGIRTPGLMIANHSLYQLSYSPTQLMKHFRPGSFCQAKSGKILQLLLDKFQLGIHFVILFAFFIHHFRFGVFQEVLVLQFTGNPLQFFA